MSKKKVEKLMHIFCYNEDQEEKMEASMTVFKSVFSEMSNFSLLRDEIALIICSDVGLLESKSF